MADLLFSIRRRIDLMQSETKYILDQAEKRSADENVSDLVAMALAAGKKIPSIIYAAKGEHTHELMTIFDEVDPNKQKASNDCEMPQMRKPK